MDLNDLRYFALIVQHGGFTAAERVSHVHRSKLSRRVAQLEASLGVRLLQRTTRRLALTDAGKIFYDHCAAMLLEAEAAHESVHQLRTEPVGTVRITCPAVMAQLYLIELISRFMVKHPKVRIELEATDRNVNLIDERFDIAVRARNAARNEPGLIAREVGSGRFILVASPAYLEKRGEPVTLHELAEWDWIGGLAAGPQQSWRLTNHNGANETLQVQPRLLCTDLQAQCKAALGGVGVAMLPERIVRSSLNRGHLQQLFAPWSTADESIHILFVSRRGMLPSVRTLLDYLYEELPGALESWGV
ncbi:LysR substrate-binding domain-containing protein [Marinobacter sp. C2H3]|uniref:LysR substrate-binding domain-containing protein n=1 Tax=Marinobacter sp. C2H3 TaxID=3119003 RepID=UPI00300F1C38